MFFLAFTGWCALNGIPGEQSKRKFDLEVAQIIGSMKTAWIGGLTRRVHSLSVERLRSALAKVVGDVRLFG